MARSFSPSDEMFWKELQSWIERQLDRCGSLPGQRDDLVSEVLLRLFVASETQELRSPFAYARTVLRNLIRDKIWELDRFERVLAELAARPSEPAEGTEPCGDDDAELARRILDGAGLTPIQDKVVRMTYLDGLKNAEVARRLELNPGTVLRHRDRALEKMVRRAAQLGVRP